MAFNQSEKNKILQLIKSKSSELGKIHGALFIPKKFVEDEKIKLKSLFQEDGFLELKKIDSLFLGGSVKDQVYNVLDLNEAS